jgi:hypothetical protein
MLDIGGRRTLLRIALAVPLFALAAFVARRGGWNPLAHGYYADYKDSPDGLYLTMAAIGFALAALCVAIGLLVVSRASRRYGFLVVAILAVTASVLPALLFKWSSKPDTWPWVFGVGWLGWLHIDVRARSVGLLIQAALAAIAVASIVAHLAQGQGRARFRGSAASPRS